MMGRAFPAYCEACAKVLGQKELNVFKEPKEDLCSWSRNNKGQNVIFILGKQSGIY